MARYSPLRRSEGTPTTRLAMAATASAAAKKVYSDAEKKACSIEAMRNGGTCEACQ